MVTLILTVDGMGVTRSGTQDSTESMNIIQGTATVHFQYKHLQRTHSEYREKFPVPGRIGQFLGVFDLCALRDLADELG
jgi:hypothetical protein